MAGAGANTVVLSGIDKDVFEKGVTEGVNNKFPLTEMFKTEQVEYKGGAGHVWNHHIGRNVSPMFTREDSAMAEGTPQVHVKGRIDIRKMTARLRMTAEAMDFYTSSEAAFVNGMANEKKRIVDDIAFRKEYAISADGRGILALLSDDPSTGVDVDVDSPANIAGASFGNRFIQKGMFIGAVNPATGALRSGIVKVTAVNSDGSDFTADASVAAGWADNDFLVQAANASVTSVLDTSYEAAFWGLPALVDDGTNRENYFGISRTDAPSLKSYVVASAGAFSLDLAQRTVDVVDAKLGGRTDVLVMHPSVRREYIKLLNADRRYNGSDVLMRPDGGTAAMKQGDLTLGEITVKAIRSIGLGQVYFLDKNQSGFKHYVGEAGKFEDRDGSIWNRDGAGASARHAFEALWYSYEQYFCENPGMNARWDGVTGQTLVVVRSE